MSQMFLLNILTQGRGLLEAGVTPTYTMSGQDPGMGHAGTKANQVGRGFAVRTKGCREENLKGPSGEGNKQLVKLLYGMEYTS